MEIERMLAEACWAGRSLFARGRAAGSAANLSVVHDGVIYITEAGSCFGRLTPDRFARVELRGGAILSENRPSKELPLHRMLYEAKGEAAGAVIHIHGPYMTLWSCLEHENPADVMPDHTPYLRMKVGSVGLVPFAPPGSQELFDLFAERVGNTDAYLLQNHGGLVYGRDVLEAFYAAEELEESAGIAWKLRLMEK